MISFTPPDGEFELFSYRLEMNLKSLFSVSVIIKKPSFTRIEIFVKIRSNDPLWSNVKVEFFILQPNVMITDKLNR